VSTTIGIVVGAPHEPGHMVPLAGLDCLAEITETNRPSGVITQLYHHLEVVILFTPANSDMQMHACPNLRRFVLSPATACPALTTLNLSHCASLRQVHIQSSSLQAIDISNNPELTKVPLSVMDAFLTFS
jgi:hypothetical protein